MKENETNVATEGTSPEPAKTAANETIASSPGAPPAGAIELPQETNVSDASGVLLNSIQLHLDLVQAAIETKIEAAKAEILAKVSELGAAKSTHEAVPATTAPAPTLEPAAAPASRTGPTHGVMVEDQAHELVVGDPVKVWADAAHKYFHMGTISAVHGQGDAYEVTLENESVTKVPAAGLEFDDRR